MAGIDDQVAIIGDWVPPTPSPRTLFSAVLGGDDGAKKSILKPPGENGVEGLLLGAREHIVPRNPDKNDVTLTGVSGDQLTKLSALSEQKLNSGGGLMERMVARAGFNAPKLNTETIRSADLSLNPDAPSPYLTIPPGLSPTTLLESPVFLSNSLAQPSPTTGKFPFVPNGNSNSSTLILEATDGRKDNLLEDINASSFAFKPGVESGSSFFLGAATKITLATNQSVDHVKVHTQSKNRLDALADLSRSSTEKDMGTNSIAMDTGVFDAAGGSADSPPLCEQQDEEGDQRGGGDSMVGGGGGGGALSEDGYNWRKYGQKQVKGSEYPRSYYKCTHPNCQVKKKVERSHEGHITEIIYKGAHNHPKPPLNRRSAIGSSNPVNDMQLDIHEQTRALTGADCDPAWAYTQKGSASGTPDWGHDNFEVTSSASMGPDHCNPTMSLQAQNGTRVESVDAVDASSTFSNDEDEDDRGTLGSVSLGYDEGDESESKRRKLEAYATEMSGATRAIREPRVVVQTTSEVDILDDGYRWRKYGQKVVKGNPNPRSYYKCTSAGCTVRKHVERASHDLKSVITTYEGKHNHDVPAARNSSHVNPGASGVAPAQAVTAAVHRPEPSQVHSGMTRFERPPSLGSFSLPGRQPLGPSPAFSFGMSQPGLVNLAMAGLSSSHGKLPVLPVHPYLAQQRQVNELGFMLPKGEPKVEPTSDPGLNLPNGATVYHQIMGGLQIEPQM
ncbi:probable WRKY transcription factor 2 [Malania oleifera]|uniref:probable WRKY transcription factor 2 n=1 Tax=Malania oleifera TaxID=397392 RepID=UPI0025AEAE17|nr:probable WRKY transcription factor 2 [Malania oleifera]XP_057984011.1 probable WRKY transcription factor 2 [Malania oleifera]